MLQRTLFNKTHPCVVNFLRLGYVNKFSNDANKSDESTQSTTEKATQVHSENDFKAPDNVEDVSRLLKESATYSDAHDKSWATTPYPKDVITEENEIEVPKVEPNDTSILLFPGQGTIKVGMVKKYMKFTNAKVLFEIANEVLNYDLLKICMEGPQEKLNQTQFNQPATVVLSLAALEKLREERPKVFDTCTATAGYSIGEITALIFSGAMSFEDGIRLVSVRGTAMQFASDKCKQGMLSVFCHPNARVSAACESAQKWARDMGVEDPVCKIAIYLYTQGKILAGNEEALQYIEKNSKEFGLSKPTRLPVSGAFHTPLMTPALKSVSKILSTIEIETPRCKVYSNYLATPYSNLRFMKKTIVKQIVSPVKWEQCMQALYSRPPGTSFPRTFDVASAGRMRAILKLINAKAHVHCIAV